MSTDWDGPFRAAGYLLPQFHSYAAGKGPDEKTLGWLYSAYGGQSTYALPHPPPASYLPLPPGTRTIIALDEAMAESLSEQWSAQRERVPLSDGSEIYVLRSPGAAIEGLILEGDHWWPNLVAGSR